MFYTKATSNSQGKRSKGPLQTLKGRGPKSRFKLSREEVQRAASNSQGKRSKGSLKTPGKRSKGPLQTLKGRGPRGRFKLYIAIFIASTETKKVDPAPQT